MRTRTTDMPERGREDESIEKLHIQHQGLNVVKMKSICLFQASLLLAIRRKKLRRKNKSSTKNVLLLFYVPNTTMPRSFEFCYYILEPPLQPSPRRGESFALNVDMYLETSLLTIKQSKKIMTTDCVLMSIERKCLIAFPRYAN